jgi:hypothetical protein
LQQEFDDLIQPDYSLGQLRHFTGFDFSGHDLDAPFPLVLQLRFVRSVVSLSRSELMALSPGGPGQDEGRAQGRSQ